VVGHRRHRSGQAQDLAEIAGNQKHIEQCPLYLAFVADMSRNERMSQAEQVTFENLPYLETFTVACIDAAMAAQNAVVAAESLGLRTVYIAPCATTRPRCTRCWACRKRPSSCSACVSAMPIPREERGQAPFAAIDRVASRAL